MLTDNIHGCISGWCRDDNLLGTPLQVSGCLFLSGEYTGRLDHVIGTRLSPGYGARVSLGIDIDGLAIDDELAIRGADGALESTMSRVKLEHVNLTKKDMRQACNLHQDAFLNLRVIYHILEIDEWVIDTDHHQVRIIYQAKGP